jgi:hypothetical protein
VIHIELTSRTNDGALWALGVLNFSGNYEHFFDDFKSTVWGTID